MRTFAPLLAILGGCQPPGTLLTPSGSERFRTMMYRVGVLDGAPELVLVLTNGELSCGQPNYTDTNEMAQAVEALLAAACREGAKHLVLRLYQLGDRWSGRYDGRTRASVYDLSADTPRVAKGAYYAVEEAFLIELDGLNRGYAASDDVWFPELGDGGEVVIDHETEDQLGGSFSFPAEGLSGTFRADACTKDTSLLDKIADSPLTYCP